MKAIVRLLLRPLKSIGQTSVQVFGVADDFEKTKEKFKH